MFILTQSLLAKCPVLTVNDTGDCVEICPVGYLTDGLVCEKDVYDRIFHVENVKLHDTQGFSLQRYLGVMKNLEEATFIVRFRRTKKGDVQALLGASNSQHADSYFNLYVTDTQIGYEMKYVNDDKVVDLEKQYLDFQFNEGINTVAFKVIKNYGYKLYINGFAVRDYMALKTDGTYHSTSRFFKDIPNIDSIYLGRIVRNGTSNQQIFVGDIDFAEFYSQPLPDRYLTHRTAETSLQLPESIYRTEKEDIFSPGMLGSNNFRIPSIVKTKAGTIITSIDVRRNNGQDSPNNIDIAVRRKLPGSKVWEEPFVILDLPQNASSIDTAKLVDEETGRVFLLVTMYSGNKGIWDAKAGSGYVTIDGKQYLILVDQSNQEYSVREDGIVYDNQSVKTVFKMTSNYDLYKDGAKVDNVLTTTAELKIFCTSYLIMMYSDDEGQSWTGPIDLNPQVKTNWQKNLLAGPGHGIQLKFGPHNGRILFSVYSWTIHNYEASHALYSDDHGETWTLGKSPAEEFGPVENITNAMHYSESSMAEMPDGQIKMFIRNTGGGQKVRVSTSYDGGETFEPSQVEPLLNDPNCLISVIRYEGKIDGQDAVIFSNANNTGRRYDGVVRIGLLVDAGKDDKGRQKWSFDWKYSKLLNPGWFAYSCLSMAENGNIGWFYEPTEYTNMAYMEFSPEFIKQKEQMPEDYSVKVVFDNIQYTSGQKMYIYVYNKGLNMSMIGERTITIVDIDADVSIKFEQVKSTTASMFVFQANAPTVQQNNSYKFEVQPGFELHTLALDPLLFPKIVQPIAISTNNQQKKFVFNGTQMFLNGKQFDIISGEMHPSRIPQKYWWHRIEMARAMGVNTISIYVFWNQHEVQEGYFSFYGQNNISQFIDMCQQLEMQVILRPGPFVCGEWDFGGIPSYLLRDKNLNIRSVIDTNFKYAAERYINALKHEILPEMIFNGGCILMVQIENEYGSWPVARQEKEYVDWLVKLWEDSGVTGPFFTADVSQVLNDAIHPDKAAIGLDGECKDSDFKTAANIDPNVPVMVTEIYPGWLRHWYEADWDSTDISTYIADYLKNKRGFNFYVIHGGTNFGTSAGANGDDKSYMPDLTSYDYGAPIAENGNKQGQYDAYRKLIFDARGVSPIAIPAPINAQVVEPFDMVKIGNIQGQKMLLYSAEDPLHFEYFGQNQGFINYKVQLPIGSSGELILKVHDYGQIYLNGEFLNVVNAAKSDTLELHMSTIVSPGTLEVLVEGMGHKNAGIAMEKDVKGIIKATFNGYDLKNWSMERLRLESFPVDVANKTIGKYGGGVYRGTFVLDQKPGDTYLDMQGYSKGMIWVNGHNLGRYWHSVGPQERLYCPGVWLKQDMNEVLVLDQGVDVAAPIQGFEGVKV